MFTLKSTQDDNIWHELSAETYEEALEEALTMLGWFITERNT